MNVIPLAAPVLPSMQDILDTLPAHVAVVDEAGVIVCVNRAWVAFGTAGGLTDAAFCVGTNYLDLCDQVTGDCAADARKLARALRSVLSGQTLAESMEYPCHSPTEQNWFRADITPIRTGQGLFAMLAHTRITADRRTHEELVRYQNLFDAIPYPVWVYDPATLRFLAVNDMAVRRYGHPRDRLLQMKVTEIRPPEAVPAFLAQIGRTLEQHTSAGIWEHMDALGRRFKVNITSHRIHWGGLQARLVLAEDVTEKLAAESALIESEARFQQLARTLEEVFWLYDVERAEFLYVSPGYERVWGRSVARLQQRPQEWLDAVHPDDRGAMAAAFAGQSRGLFDLEFRIVRADGAIRHIKAKAEPVHSADGQVRRMAGAARDITAQHAKDARLRLLETAVNRLNDIVLITEAEPFDEPGPKIVFVNDAFQRRTGFTREETIGRSPRMLQGPATQRDALDRIRVALEAWQPVREELINYTKDGRPFWLELDIVPLADEKGWFTHWVAVERDISERKEMEAHLQQSRKLESLGQLTGGVAHDFNNLLTVMMGNTEILLDRIPPGGLEHRLLRMIGQATERGAELTRRLLAFARRQPLQPRTVDVQELVHGMRDLLVRTLGATIDVRLLCEPATGQAQVDPGQLENAVLNLAINARDAMPEGGALIIETRNVELDAAYVARYVDLQPGRYVCLAVSDTGVGIDPQVLERVFEPFFTTKDKSKGTGLGLAMVYGFVKQSHGHAEIYSEVGLGTTVKLYLPRRSGAQEVEEVEPAASAVRRGTGQTVLVVEDNELVLEFAVAQLESLGYRVVQARDGLAALEVLASDVPLDLLFTDVVMPGGLSGFELGQRAAALRPGLPVLYTSGYPEGAISAHSTVPPDVRLLTKPYRLEQLSEQVTAALSGAGA
jgi:PAS domain S-box-containing protein